MKKTFLLSIPLFFVLVFMLISPCFSNIYDSEYTDFLGYYNNQLENLLTHRGYDDLLVSDVNGSADTNFNHIHPSTDSVNISAGGETFKLTSGSMTLTKVIFKMSKTSGLQGNVTVCLYNITGTLGTDSTPTGSPLAISDIVDVSTFAGSLSEVSFFFTGVNRYILQNNTGYAVAFLCPSSGIWDSENKVFFRRDSANGYANGNYFKYSNGWVSTGYSDYDAYFKVYGMKELGLVLTHWYVTNDTSDCDWLRTDLTIATFLEAYKITNNTAYLNASIEGFDASVNLCFNMTTNLFAKFYDVSDNHYRTTGETLWSGIMLNALFELYSVTGNSTHLIYAEKFADGIYNYVINKTTWLPYGKVNVTSGAYIDHTCVLSMDIGRLIGGYIKGFEVTGNVTYKEIALNLTSGFWNKRNPTTNLVCTSFNALTGANSFDYCDVDLDPIQNVLLYAYSVTHDAYFLNVAKTLTDSQLQYGWLGDRIVHALYLTGSVKNSYSDLVGGSPMYVINLAQLYILTSSTSYLTKAETFWNILKNKAKVNGVYVRYLYSNNSTSLDGSLFANQMMIQASAILYYAYWRGDFLNHPEYAEDINATVNSFWSKFKFTYGTCVSINVTTGNPIDATSTDWLDSSSYILGSALYFYKYYPYPLGDPFYYMPYYPMLITLGYLDTWSNPTIPSSHGSSHGSNTDMTRAFLELGVLLMVIGLLGKMLKG